MVSANNINKHIYLTFNYKENQQFINKKPR